MNFMNEGGPFMWLIVITAVVTLGIVVMKRSESGSRLTAIQGAVACLALGSLGFTLGLGRVMAVVGQADTAPDMKWAFLVQGTKETSNNMILGATLCVLLLVVASALRMSNRAAGRIEGGA